MRWKQGSRLKLVSESDLPTRTRALLREVRESLGVPVVPKLYQAFAAYPKFLEVHWKAFRPAIQSRQFFVLGARLAAESYTRAHNYFDIPPLRHSESASPASSRLSISQELDYYQYLDPLLLLIAAAQMQAFDGSVGNDRGKAERAVHPDFVVAPSLLDDAKASPALQRSWQERTRLLELAFISDEHRALACWSDFYLKYWGALKGVLHSPVYADCQYRLADSALNMTAELPVRIETGVAELMESGLSEEDVASVTRINELFVQALTGLVLDITFARIGFEKGASTEPRAQAPTREPLHEANQPPPETPPKKKARSPIRAA
jgi:hypothetical protein